MYDKLVSRIRFACEIIEGPTADLLTEAADAIEELQQTAEHYKGCSDDWYKEACDYKAMLPRWIPVTERLPEEDGMYLVHGTWSASGRKVTDTCEFYVHDGYFRAAWNFDVTHWMPLPEPPKEDT